MQCSGKRFQVGIELARGAGVMTASNYLHFIILLRILQVYSSAVDQGWLTGSLVFFIIRVLVIGPVFIPVPGLVDLKEHIKFL